MPTRATDAERERDAAVAVAARGAWEAQVRANEADQLSVTTALVRAMRALEACNATPPMISAELPELSIQHAFLWSLCGTK
jgi:hypothetical protein